MAKRKDIAKTGPQNYKQLQEQNREYIDLNNLLSTGFQLQGKGPIITPQQQAKVDQENAPTKPKYVTPYGTQRNNSYKIKDATSRTNWWKNTGINIYSEQFPDISIKNGEFENRQLERIYRDILFTEEFQHLPEYKELIKMDNNERDSFYARWAGKANEYQQVTTTKNGKTSTYTLPGILNQDKTSFQNSSEGRRAGRILASLQYNFNTNLFDDWSIPEREQFYNDWDIEQNGTQKFIEAAEQYPELNLYQTDLKTAYSRVKKASEGTSFKKDKNEKAPSTSVLNTTNNPLLYSPSNDSFNIYTLTTDKIMAPVVVDTAVQEHLKELSNLWKESEAIRSREESKYKTESEARKKKYEEQWYRQNPVHHFTLTGTEDKWWINRKNAAKVYAEEQERRYNLTQDQKNKEDEYNKVYEQYKQFYKDNWRSLIYIADYNSPIPTPLKTIAATFKKGIITSKLENFFKSTPEQVRPIFKNGEMSRLLEMEANKYAINGLQKYIRETTTVPAESNPYSLGIDRSQIKQFAYNYSGLYKEFQSSNWLPDFEIPWDNIYNKTKDLIQTGHFEQASYIIDKELEKIIDDNQTFTGHDNLGHVGSGAAAAKQFASMGLEALTEGVTFVPSLVIGLGEATFSPDELQTESGMNFFSRWLDNTIHNDWLGFASNQRVSDWAADVIENNVIYGSDLGSFLLKGSGTAGAQVGNAIQFLIGAGELKLASNLTKKAITATERTLKREIVNAAQKNKLELFGKKATEEVNLLAANYAEAVQQSLDGERQVHQISDSKKWELIEKYYMPTSALTPMENVDGLSGTISEVSPQDFTFTSEELDEVIDREDTEWKTYLKALRNGTIQMGEALGSFLPDYYELLEKIRTTQNKAQGLHNFNQANPDYDDMTDYQGRIRANIDAASQTALLYLGDKLFGGLDKHMLDYTMGKRAIQVADIKSRIKGSTIGKLTTGKAPIGKTVLTATKVPLTETITEVGQQSGSAITKQIAEHNMDNFINNHLYGNGLASWSAMTYEQLWNLDKEAFLRDASLKETVLQTLITTPLMPSGIRVSLPERGINQSTLSYITEASLNLAPIKTQIGTQITGAIRANKEAKAYVDYINRWGADPNNQKNLRGIISMTNFGLDQYNALLNNDEVAYNNAVFSRVLSEAIMLANTEGAEFSTNRLQWLRNLSDAKSLSNEEKAKAIQSFRKEAAGNSAARNLTDSQVLDVMEKSSKRVLDMYDKVKQEIAANENYTNGVYNWQQQSAKLFNKFALEDLKQRISDKEDFLNIMKEQLSSLDLGETKTPLNKLYSTPNNKLVISGLDILSLPALKRAEILNPKNLKRFNKEQQNIITKLINALDNTDARSLDYIQQIADEIILSNTISEDYKKSLSSNWQSKKAKKEGERIKKRLETSNKTATFKNSLTQAKTVNELYNSIKRAREVGNFTEGEKQVSVDEILNGVTDINVKNKIKEARKIERAVNSLSNLIAKSNLSEEFQDNLIDQVERLANKANSVQELFNIDNYTIPVSPNLTDNTAAIVTNILSTVKNNIANTQTVTTKPVKSYENSETKPKKSTDLGDRDVDTTEPVNDKPLVRYKIDEAKEIIKQLSNILDQISDYLIRQYEEGIDTSTEIEKLQFKYNSLLTDLTSKCPEGFKIVESNNTITLVKELQKDVQEETKQTNEDIDDVESREDEHTLNYTRFEEEMPTDLDYTPIDTSLDAYPDDDPRSIRTVAVVQFEENGQSYSYPIRDENVQVGDGIFGSFGKNGTVIEIRPVKDEEELNLMLKDKDGNNRPRPRFINRHSQVQTQETQVNNTKEQIVDEDDKGKNSTSTTDEYTNRSKSRQTLVNNNITPDVSELNLKALTEQKYEDNSDSDHINIINQLREEGAFEYVNDGKLNIGDEIEFVCTKETMPNGSTQVVIWEVTEPKDGIERTNAKFQGKQLLNVLDQTGIGGKRKELIDKIRKEYADAGSPDTFLSKEKYKVDGIVNGIIPIKSTTPSEAIEDSVIETNNLKKGLTKQNGVWGITFFNKKKGKMVHLPIVFKQTKVDRNNVSTELYSDKRYADKTVKTIKTTATGSSTNTVMMVVPTPTGFQATHDVYVLTREIPNSIDKYKEVINKGAIGNRLVNKIINHLKDIKTVTAFSDVLGFTRGISEYVYNDINHGRIDLGYRSSEGNNVLLSAVKSGNKYIIVDNTDARQVLDDNNGQGYELEDICKKYLNTLIDNPDVNATMRLNMNAIVNDPSIIQDLIEDGLLWAPNAINGRFTMRNTGFVSSLDTEGQQGTEPTAPVQPKQPKQITKTAPVANSNAPSSTVVPKKKETPKPKNTESVVLQPKRKKRKAGENPSPKPVSTKPTETTPNKLTTEVSNKEKSLKPFMQLDEETKQHIIDKGFTEQTYNSLTQKEKENILNC